MQCIKELLTDWLKFPDEMAEEVVRNPSILLHEKYLQRIMNTSDPKNLQKCLIHCHVGPDDPTDEIMQISELTSLSTFICEKYLCEAHHVKGASLDYLISVIKFAEAIERPVLEQMCQSAKFMLIKAAKQASILTDVKVTEEGWQKMEQFCQDKVAEDARLKELYGKACDISLRWAAIKGSNHKHRPIQCLIAAQIVAEEKKLVYL